MNCGLSNNEWLGDFNGRGSIKEPTVRVTVEKRMSTKNDIQGALAARSRRQECGCLQVCDYVNARQTSRVGKVSAGL